MHLNNGTHAHTHTTVGRLQEITSDVRVGFGGFVDKTVRPYTRINLLVHIMVIVYSHTSPPTGTCIYMYNYRLIHSVYLNEKVNLDH